MRCMCCPPQTPSQRQHFLSSQYREVLIQPASSRSSSCHMNTSGCVARSMLFVHMYNMMVDSTPMVAFVLICPICSSPSHSVTLTDSCGTVWSAKASGPGSVTTTRSEGWRSRPRTESAGAVGRGESYAGLTRAAGKWEEGSIDVSAGRAYKDGWVSNGWLAW
jgi:hypothetical protein